MKFCKEVGLLTRFVLKFSDFQFFLILLLIVIGPGEGDEGTPRTLKKSSKRS